MPRILLIDDNPHDRLLAIRSLEHEFTNLAIEPIARAEDLEQALISGEFDLVITDYQLRWNNGLTVLQVIKSQYPDRPVIMFTNSGTQEIAVEAMKSGLDDYVLKSVNHYMRLPAAVRMALERAETQRKAAGLEMRFQTLLNQLNVGIYRLTSSGDFLEGNPAFLRLLGLDTLVAEMPMNQGLSLYYQPDDYAELLNQLRQNGSVSDRDIQLRRADGSQIWVRLSKTFTRINGSMMIDGLIEDISARKQIEQQLLDAFTRDRAARTAAENQERRSTFLAEASRLLADMLDYRTTLLQVARLAVPTLADWCLVDLIETSNNDHSIIAACDPAKEAVLTELKQRYPGFAYANSLAQKALKTQMPELISEVSDKVLQSLAQDDEHFSLLRQLNLQSYLVVPLTARGRTSGTMAFASARPDYRYTYADLEMAQALAQRAAIAIDNARLYQEAQEANRLKDEFLAIVSHELRTPLNSILGWAQILCNHQLEPAKITKALETIERNARLQNKLINDILDISRIIQHQLRLEMQPVDLVPMIQAVIQDMQLMAQAKSIQLTAQLAAGVGQVLGDRERLQQIVWNLLSNAVKFTPDQGQVTVRVEAVGQFMQLTVIDTGQGISAEFLPHVFDRFRQADSSKTRTQGGLGLGLAIVRHLVEMHNGTVQVSSDGEGRGATFTVQLPILEHARIASAESTAISPSLQGLKVLAVDDDEATRDLLSFTLEQADAEVVAVDSVAAALEALAGFLPDLVLSDIGMPDENGYSLIRKIRAMSGAAADVPAIAFTAFAKEEDRDAAIAAGFQQHIAKPIDPFELLSLVARVTRRE